MKKNSLSVLSAFVSAWCFSLCLTSSSFALTVEGEEGPKTLKSKQSKPQTQAASSSSSSSSSSSGSTAGAPTSTNFSHPQTMSTSTSDESTTDQSDNDNNDSTTTDSTTTDSTTTDSTTTDSTTTDSTTTDSATTNSTTTNSTTTNSTTTNSTTTNSSTDGSTPNESDSNRAANSTSGSTPTMTVPSTDSSGAEDLHTPISGLRLRASSFSDLLERRRRAGMESNGNTPLSTINSGSTTDSPRPSRVRHFSFEGGSNNQDSSSAVANPPSGMQQQQQVSRDHNSLKPLPSLNESILKESHSVESSPDPKSGNNLSPRQARTRRNAMVGQDLTRVFDGSIFRSYDDPQTGAGQTGTDSHDEIKQIDSQIMPSSHSSQTSMAVTAPNQPFIHAPIPMPGIINIRSQTEDISAPGELLRSETGEPLIHKNDERKQEPTSTSVVKTSPAKLNPAQRSHSANEALSSSNNKFEHLRFTAIFEQSRGLTATAETDASSALAATHSSSSSSSSSSLPSTSAVQSKREELDVYPKLGKMRNRPQLAGTTERQREKLIFVIVDDQNAQRMPSFRVLVNTLIKLEEIDPTYAKLVSQTMTGVIGKVPGWMDKVKGIKFSNEPTSLARSDNRQIEVYLENNREDGVVTIERIAREYRDRKPNSNLPVVVILMDRQMPDVDDGVWATRTLREHGFPIAIYGHTTNRQPHEEASYMVAGLNGFVNKPMGDVALTQIRNAIAKAEAIKQGHNMALYLVQRATEMAAQQRGNSPVSCSFSSSNSPSNGINTNAGTLPILSQEEALNAALHASLISFQQEQENEIQRNSSSSSSSSASTAISFSKDEESLSADSKKN